MVLSSFPSLTIGWNQSSMFTQGYFLFLCLWGSCFFLVFRESGKEKSLVFTSLKASGRVAAFDQHNVQPCG